MSLPIVDRDGVEALTMRALGRELGVDAMAVCHRVPSKDELLGLIVEVVDAKIRRYFPRGTGRSGSAPQHGSPARRSGGTRTPSR